MDLVPVWQSNYVHEAHMAKNYLESEGIGCVLHDELTTQTVWHLSAAFGGIRLMVLKEEADAAREKLREAGYVVDAEVLNQQQTERIDAKSIADKGSCPRCGSTDIGKSRSLSWLGLVVFFFLLTLVPAYRIKYHCFECGHDWRLVRGRNQTN